MSCLWHQSARTKTLPVVSKETKEVIREKICTERQTILVQLPSDKAWGLIIGDAGKGMLYVVRVKRNSEAMKAGIEEHIHQIDDESIDVIHTPLSLSQYIEKVKEEMKSRQIINMKLMRKRIS
jgi:hypothetical protein